MHQAKAGHRSIVSISSTSEEVQSLVGVLNEGIAARFPLVQLPKKFKGPGSKTLVTQSFYTPIFAGGINFCE